MRIAFVIPELHNQGGTERCFAGLGRALARRGHEIVVFAARFEGSALPEARWWKVPRITRPHMVRFFVFLGMSALVRWVARLRGERWDVLVSSGPDAPNADVAWFHCCATTLGNQIAQEEARGLQRIRGWANIAAYRAIALVERAVVRSQASSVCVSGSLRNDLLDEAGRQTGDRLTVIHNGVEVDEFGASQQSREAMRAELGLAEDTLAVLFVGHNWRRKGLATVLEALKQIRARRPEQKVCLVVAGGAGRPEGFPCETPSFPVCWLGTRSDMANIYAASDLLVLPSELESFGMPVLEAMASGLPAVVSASAGVAEISRGDDMVKLEDPNSASELAEKLLPLLDSAELRKEVGERGRRTAEDYSWDRVAERFEGVCASAAADKTPKAADRKQLESEAGA